MADTESDESVGDDERSGQSVRKTALITGCSSGIGRETALQFLDEEWTVYATARDLDDISDLADAGCETAELDVTDENQCRAVVEQAISETGRIDCLVNNAGYGQLGPIEEVPTEVVSEQFDVNVYGPHRLIRAVLPHMRERRTGTIVNVSSVAGRISYPGNGVYCGSKFALEAMSDALRAEVDPFDIDVVLVEPGPVDTQFENRAVESADEGAERSGAYEWFYDLVEDSQVLGGGGVGAVSAGEVADSILDAATRTAPPARYPVGPVAKYGVFARFLPDAMQDKLYGVVRKLV
ncbi:NADP-dependent 3-hydroxy acid dehydrogenase YdfG [Natronoarchaeum philippinense]|uniref:NADP-dependent 3-hydroxy acid dehydrogenase YdfG n=1 Tax=Natronoarchaeum philippinense TaxID=558529 RepID=A0A285NU73_NATPI|nr:SDR family oxidoreductase [Natronoarchaeum philippinense]SNZ13044.1 NADP-dependent 3-hydroxy acid dehydrogenase YdfG [Natronoarchaeum philippinense]